MSELEETIEKVENQALFLRTLRNIAGDNTLDDPILKIEQYFKKELENAYQKSKWYSARFVAGSALHDPTLQTEFINWTEKLSTNITESDLDRIDDIAMIANKTKAPYYKELLRDIYLKGKRGESRNLAGQHLGYSNLRIWYHDHPDFKYRLELTGFIATGIAIYAYLAR